MFLRFRFHGRGGQGIKTASRILGTAAFRSGYHVQDTPVYGAERRGAPMTAFVRISDTPIRDRGPIHRPDVVLVADARLLGDPAARPLDGIDVQGVLFLNLASSVAPPEGLDKALRLVPLDATGLAVRRAGLPVLSAIVGAAACKISGLIDLRAAEGAVREELEALRLPPAFVACNLEAALEAYEATPAAASAAPRTDKVTPVAPAALRYAGAIAGAPSVSRARNMAERVTGSWRVSRPAIDKALCVRCDLCLLACPEGCILLDAQGYPVFDEVHCKGCLICEEACPREGAVAAVREEGGAW